MFEYLMPASWGAHRPQPLVHVRHSSPAISATRPTSNVPWGSPNRVQRARPRAELPVLRFGGPASSQGAQEVGDRPICYGARAMIDPNSAVKNFARLAALCAAGTVPGGARLHGARSRRRHGRGVTLMATTGMGCSRSERLTIARWWNAFIRLDVEATELLLHARMRVTCSSRGPEARCEECRRRT